jgi:hypothetical protein
MGHELEIMNLIDFIKSLSHFDDNAVNLLGFYSLPFDRHQVKLEQRQLQAGTA